MIPLLKVLRDLLRTPFGMALGLGLGFFMMVTWEQSYFWRLREDYSFGWLVPVLAGYVLWERWSRVEAALAACGADGAPRLGGWRNVFFVSGACVALAGGGGGLLLGCLHRATIGPSQPGALIVTLGAVLITSALIVLTAPVGKPGPCGRWWTDVRVRLLGCFAFPLGVWLISAPLVSALERPLLLWLLRHVMTAVSMIFGLLGLPIEQQGNVLVLPTGRVGVQEACSGIRSLTGSLFAGSFLAAIMLERLWAKMLLVVLGLLMAVAVNLLRASLLTLWAFHHGPASIEGTVHDVVGYAELGMTVVGLLVVVTLLRRIANILFTENSLSDSHGRS